MFLVVGVPGFSAEGAAPAGGQGCASGAEPVPYTRNHLVSEMVIAGGRAWI